MRIIHITFNDLLQMIRDWKAGLFYLAMPIAFTLLFGFMFGGSETNPDEIEDSRLLVGIVAESEGQLSSALYRIIDDSDTIRPVGFDGQPSYSEVEAMVAEGQFAAVVIIPTGFDSVWSGKALPEIVTVLKSDTISGQTAQNSLQVVINRLDSAVKAADFSAELREQFQPFSGDADRQAYKMRILNQAVSAWEKPPLTIMDSQTGSDEDQGETSNAFSQSSPGMMVQFAIAGLIGAAEVIVLERRSGSLQRLLTTATTRAEILIGHFLAIFTMIFIQFVLLIGFAVIFLDVPYLNEPLATLLITLATVIFTASLGLLIGILAKSEEQAVIFSLIPMFILSGLGGAWMPLEFTHETFQTVGHLTPMAWAMDGYQNIIIRGQGLESVFIPSMVLVGFSSVCLLISIWRFRYQ